MKKLLFLRPDGGITLTVASAGIKRAMPDERECLNFVRADHDNKWPEDKFLGEFDQAELPGGYFRDCWRDGGNKAVVDMALARAQRMAEIRAKRDYQLMRVDSRTKDAQTLRDIPNNLTAAKTLEAFTTPEELEAFEPLWPTK